MAITLALLTPDMSHICIYKHTGEACLTPEDPAPAVHPRFQVRMNFLWPAERPPVLPRELCRPVRMCESSGTLSLVQMAGGTCVVVMWWWGRASWVGSS